MSIWKTIGSTGLEVLKEVSKLAIEVSEQERLKKEKEEAEFARMKKQAEILSKELIEATRKKEVKIVYGLESLQKMSTEDLKKEVYAIYQENKSVFSDNYDSGKEARSLYFESVHSEQRYRAKLVKFLYEKGNI